jgi:hypothetical protein
MELRTSVPDAFVFTGGLANLSLRTVAAGITPIAIRFVIGQTEI